MVSNIVILHRFNNFTGYGEFTIFLMVLAYYLAMVMESSLGNMFPVLSHIAPTMFSSFIVWTSLICMCMTTSAGELALRAWYKIIKEDGSTKNGYSKFIGEQRELK